MSYTSHPKYAAVKLVYFNEELERDCYASFSINEALHYLSDGPGNQFGKKFRFHSFIGSEDMMFLKTRELTSDEIKELALEPGDLEYFESKRERK